MCINRTACVCVHLCRPTSLDAFVFGFVAPLYKAALPSSPLQRHLTQLDNITRFCDNILAVYFSPDRPGKSAGNIPTFSKHTHTHRAITPPAFSSFCLCFTTSALCVCLCNTRCSCLLSSGFPSTSVSRFSPACPGHQGCQPPKINTACK